MSHVPIVRKPAKPLAISAGLSRIPRQIGTFADFRRALLDDIGDAIEHPELAAWRARGDDLGVMLIEMWAYVCDSLAFYDEVIAHESYLRTARRRPSVRMLVDILGYVPHPAVSASALLAAVVDGRQPVKISAGTAFRSGAFDGQPPQVFELEREATLHPLNNGWRVDAPRPTLVDATSLGSAEPFLLLERAGANVRVGASLLVEIVDGGGKQRSASSCVVKDLSAYSGVDGTKYTRVGLRTPLLVDPRTRLADMSVLAPTQRAGVASLNRTLSTLVLNGIYRQISPGDPLLLSHGDVHVALRVQDVRDVLIQVAPGGETSVKDAAGTIVRTITAPPVQAPATRVTFRVAPGQTINPVASSVVVPSSLLSGPPATAQSAGATSVVDFGTVGKTSAGGIPVPVPIAAGNQPVVGYMVQYAFVDVGKVTREPSKGLGERDDITLTNLRGGVVEVPPDPFAPRRFLVEDRDGRAYSIEGTLDGTLASGSTHLELASGQGWSPPLAPPVTVSGNVLRVSRGETVLDEILGSGDASQGGQTFKLKKKPLAYVFSAAADEALGAASTLRIWVEGMAWREVRTFFGTGPDDPVYIVRQDDEEDSFVTFGDGRRGRRLPTGADNVVAEYRFGSGAAAPPGGSITQLAKPVKGLSSVHNPLTASGGADRESAANVKRDAPRSALTFGRIVSILDFESVAGGLPGVRAVRAEWRWLVKRQSPVAHLAYVGEAGIEADVTRQLRAMCEPATAIEVEAAVGRALYLSLDLQIDARYREDDVLAAVRRTLQDRETGMLSPERIGIGQPLFRSRVVERVLSVAGAVSVRGIQFSIDQSGVLTSFTDSALEPGAGTFFDLESGNLTLNGRGQADD